MSPRAAPPKVEIRLATLSAPEVASPAPTPPEGPLDPPRPFAGYATEEAAYLRARPGLLGSAPGHFVVFVGEEMAGPCETIRDAYLAGRRRFGPGPFYIKQVLAEDPIFEPIALEPCPS